ncbi:hypothetical protein [Sinorhizobium psoraleae]|uniref:Uncharacterized protein n=1 Tax=Sinorhizobium psoraleae TaxID=520838 RepID=A0ABT4KD81_9HYPH|nr:hypothetical protein [Sinorhizobium psoraleae]MCZ4089326.1 hypothetical protein [Sinorhizobium psoraleae]
MADAIAGAFRRGRLDKADREISTVNKDLVSNLLSGGSAAPASSSSIPMTSAAGEVAATSPASNSAAASGVLPASFLGAVDTTEGAGGYDTLYGHAQRGKFAGTDVSAMPIRDVLAFTDPSGPYAQSVKSQIGRVATPVGRHQIVGTTLRNAVAELGLDPNATFDAATQDRIALHLAKNRVASADTMPGKIAALRSEWHGFRGVPDAQMAQIVADIEGAPVEVASTSPQTATDAIEAVAPISTDFTSDDQRVLDEYYAREHGISASGDIVPPDQALASYQQPTQTDPMVSAPNYDPVAAGALTAPNQPPPAPTQQAVAQAMTAPRLRSHKRRASTPPSSKRSPTRRQPHRRSALRLSCLSRNRRVRMHCRRCD